MGHTPRGLNGAQPPSISVTLGRTDAPRLDRALPLQPQEVQIRQL
jgi:hypothetical protein